MFYQASVLLDTTSVYDVSLSYTIYHTIYCRYTIDLSAILQKSLDRAYFLHNLYARLDRVALGLLSQLCTFENSAELSKLSFDFDSF